MLSPNWSAAPEAVPYADVGDPQTLNLYAYAENNPVTRSDADGHTPIDDTWMQTGHDMQEVGFAFHLWAGQAEDRDFEFHPPCICSGPAKERPRTPAPADEHGNPLPPPVPLPPGKNGKPNSWQPIQGTRNRPAKWIPEHPVPSAKGGQPSASWDPEGHWDFKPGDGGPTQRYDPSGNSLTPEQAHGRSFLRDHAGAIVTGAVIVGGAVVIVVSGGSATPVVVPALVF